MFDCTFENPQREAQHYYEARYRKLIPRRDHWYNNGILKDIEKWRNTSKRSIFVAYGPYGEAPSWVTEFSLDLNHILQTRGFKVMRFLCDKDHKKKDDREWTGTDLVKRMICQLVELHPTILLDEPDALTPRTISDAMGYDDYWNIFQLLLRKTKEVFIIIDRIDRCVKDSGRRDAPSVGEELVGRLQGIINKIPTRVHILVTTAKMQSYPKSVFLYESISHEVYNSSSSLQE